MSPKPCSQQPQYILEKQKCKVLLSTALIYSLCLLWSVRSRTHDILPWSGQTPEPSQALHMKLWRPSRSSSSAADTARQALSRPYQQLSSAEKHLVITSTIQSPPLAVNKGVSEPPPSRRSPWSLRITYTGSHLLSLHAFVTHS